MELYHVLNRGVDKREIFLDDQDRARFVHDLFEFNDTAAAGSTYYSFQNLDLRSPDIANIKRERIVDIHGWCLMGNHYHLLLSELREGGLTAFIRKLNIGYAKYFNERHGRSGTLFQGRTKKILITNNGHFLHILQYIHFNPLDFLAGARDWRDRGVENSKRALAHLNSYRWSSYRDYCGEKNFPSILTKEFFSEIFPNYKQEARSCIRDLDLTSIKGLTLE